MGLEAATYIHQLNPSNPVGAVDPKAQGDDHLRMIKATLQATFPNINGAMTVSLANLNQWAGLAGAYAWTGQHSWALQMRVPDGSNLNPSIVFSSDLDTGLYKFGSNGLSITAGGVERFRVDGNSILELHSLGEHAFVDGSAALPALTFDSDIDTGFYRSGVNEVSVSSGGAPLFSFGSQGVYHWLDGSAANPAFTWASDPNTGFHRVGNDQIGISCGGARVIHVVSAATSGMTVRFDSGQIGVQDGTAGAPAYSFVSDPDTGMWRNGANGLSFSAGGVLQLYCDTVSVIARQQFQGINGSAGTPAHAFESDTDTGLYRIGADQLGFSEGGAGYRIGFRQVPRSTTVTTLAIGDVGKCVAVAAAINIPASVFSAGDCISIYNDSGASVNITISAGTLRLAGNAATGTRALAARGMATLWFNVGGATPEVICSGAGVS